MPDGIALTNRLDNTTERKLHAKVVDQVLNGPTYASRLLGKAKKFSGKQMDYTVDVERSSQFEWFTGVENLNSSAEDTTITLSYTHTAGTQPKVGIMLESFANAGELGTIPLDAFQYNKAAQEVIANVASALYGLGTGDQPNGLRVVADDGTNAANIGGQSRSTYSALDGVYTSFSTGLTLALLGTLDDDASVGGEGMGTPNINITTFAVWSLYEQLLDPQVVANYNSTGFPRMPIRGEGQVGQAVQGANAGFQFLAHRGHATIKDKYATSGSWFKMNEDTYAWHGRTEVPEEYQGMVSPVNLGSMDGYQSVAGEEAPSKFNGFFYQKPQVLPNQAGTIARFYVIGQLNAWEPRRNAQAHSITALG